MLEFSKINNKVSETLRQENNEVVYRGWLFLNENAQLENNNIIINVPNMYTKEIFEDRYLSDIESLYRNELSFDKIILKVVSENQIASPSNIGDKSNLLDDVIEKINFNVKHVYEFVENAARNGYYSVSCALSHEAVSKEEIYWSVKDFLVNKGFKVELSNLDNNYILNLSW